MAHHQIIHRQVHIVLVVKEKIYPKICNEELTAGIGNSSSYSPLVIDEDLSMGDMSGCNFSMNNHSLSQHDIDSNNGDVSNGYDFKHTNATPM